MLSFQIEATGSGGEIHDKPEPVKYIPAKKDVMGRRERGELEDASVHDYTFEVDGNVKHLHVEMGPTCLTYGAGPDWVDFESSGKDWGYPCPVRTSVDLCVPGYSGGVLHVTRTDAHRNTRAILDDVFDRLSKRDLVPMRVFVVCHRPPSEPDN